MFKVILSFAMLYLSGAISTERSLIITTSSGYVKGKLNKFNGIEFYSYQGIPYAESPTGKLRFKPPVPKKPWSGVFDATQEGMACSQLPRFYKREETTEDCLSVNVYVPKKGKDKSLPVMVFVHGGALQFLSGRTDHTYAPQYLLDRGIIYISMNYRLGPFGFLSLNIEEASGNAGLKDVLLSLKWVKQNIKNFGGNPDKITIAGHSSGSVIVNYLMLTNQSAGLFHQAMLMSGIAINPRSFAKHSMDIAFELATKLGIETNEVYKTLTSLQELDASEILDAYYNLTEAYESPLRLYAPFVPSKEIKTDHALFVTDPMEAFRKNEMMVQKIPVLVGLTSRESINLIPHVLQHFGGIKKIIENPEHLIPSNIEYPIGSQKSKKLAKLLSETYFGKNMKNFNLTTLIEFMSDSQNVYGTYFWIKQYKHITNSNELYMYIFNFNGTLNRNQFFFDTNVPGVGHGDDIPYIFVTNVTKSLYNNLDERSKQMMNTMMNFTTNFIYHGNPTAKYNNSKFQWPDYGIDENYLLLNDTFVVQKFSSSPIYPRMQFWDEIYKEYYEYIENGGEIEKKIIP